MHSHAAQRNSGPDLTFPLSFYTCNCEPGLGLPSLRSFQKPCLLRSPSKSLRPMESIIYLPHFLHHITVCTSRHERRLVLQVPANSLETIRDISDQSLMQREKRCQREPSVFSCAFLVKISSFHLFHVWGKVWTMKHQRHHVRSIG